MAELYLKQGHRDRAIAVYRELVHARPENEQLARRLSEIEQGESMIFREYLKEMVDAVPGALAATVMGFDGIAIESYEGQASDIDMASLVIEYGSATKLLRTAAEAVGSLTEIGVMAKDATVYVRPLGPDYFMAMLVSPEALKGKARYKMRITAPKILKELI